MMTSFLDRLTGRNRPSSAHIAKERLKLVLVTDRSNLPQERLEAMQAEILEVIKRYVEIDEPQIVLKIEQRERSNYLVADIPLHRDRSYQMASQQAKPPRQEPERSAPARPSAPKAKPPRTAKPAATPPHGKPARANRPDSAAQDEGEIPVSGDE